MKKERDAIPHAPFLSKKIRNPRPGRIPRRNPTQKTRPLVVLTASDNLGLAEMREPWLKMQAEFAALSSNSTHRVMDGAVHIATVTDPEIARTTVEAVHEVVEAMHAKR